MSDDEEIANCLNLVLILVADEEEIGTMLLEDVYF